MGKGGFRWRCVGRKEREDEDEDEDEDEEKMCVP